MRFKIFSGSIACCLIFLCFAIFGFAASETPEKTVLEAQKNTPETQREAMAEQGSLPKVIKLSEKMFQVGDVLVDTDRMMVSVPGKINMADGLVEYLACASYGKLHESVLSIDAKPYDIQVALLLLGLKPGDRPIHGQGADEMPCGDPVELTISWVNNGEKKQYAPENLVKNIQTRQIMKKTDWVFTGSQILDGRHMAQVEGSIVATFHDPYAMIDHRSHAGADDLLFYANKTVLPEVGTPVTLIFSPNYGPEVLQRCRCPVGPENIK